MRILGINGRMRSGKDTVAKIIQDLYPSWYIQRVAFADKLKESAAALLGIPVPLLEDLKTTDTKVLIDPDPKLDPDLYNELLGIEMTVRALLQRYGTEAHREVFADSFWIDEAFRCIDPHADLVVFTDMRFPNEVTEVKHKGGIAIKVKRAEAEGESDSHASEQFIDDAEFDFVIINDSSLDELQLKVHEMMQAILSGDH